MSARLVILAGTGTDVGKTHVAEALIQANLPSATTRRLVAWKPYESGVVEGQPSDSERLRAAALASHAGWRLEPPLRRWSAPLAPPVAAFVEGAPLDHAPLLATLATLRAEADVVLVELAGGLFAPLSATWLGVDLVRHFPEATLVVVASNRLGVLHGTIATVRAARAEHVTVQHLVVCEQATPDPSAAHNLRLLRELAHATLHSVAHASPAALADTASVCELAARLFAAPAEP